MSILKAIVSGLSLYADDLSETETKFVSYISEFGKQYRTESEYNFRLRIFAKNVAHIEETNASGEETHTLGINHMTDWSDAEYRALLGYKHEMKTKSNVVELDTTGLDLSADINWVTSGAVTPIKN